MILIASALAAPSVEARSGGVYVGTLSVTSSVEHVRSKVSDPLWIAALGGNTTQVTIDSREGDCLVASFVSPNKLATARYTVRQCPTDNGAAATMITSNAFKVYGTDWSVVPAASGVGADITYTLTMKTSLPIPSFLVSGTVKSEVLEMLNQLQDALGKP